MNALDVPPAKHEVMDQLKRMLASPRFRAAGNPSDFLKLTVNRALEGKKTTGLTAGKELFGDGYDQLLSGDVKSTAFNLRALIARYNNGEGAGDVVTISYPEPQRDKSIKPLAGEAYTPVFSYNPKHPAIIHLRLGFRFLEQSMYRDYDRAFKLFAGVLDEDPNNLGAALGFVEAMCKFADRHWENPARLHPFIASENLFAHIEGRGERYWRFWAAKAYLYQGRGAANNREARALYDQAIKLDRMATEGFLPYIEFLLLIDETEEALGLAQRYVNERVEDSTAIAQYGQLLLSAGRHDQGIGHLKAALNLDPNNCLAHETLATIFLIRRNVEDCAFHLQSLKALCDAESFEYILQFLNRNRGQIKLEGSVEKLLLGSSNASSSAIVKR